MPEWFRGLLLDIAAPGILALCGGVLVVWRRVDRTAARLDQSLERCPQHYDVTLAEIRQVLASVPGGLDGRLIRVEQTLTMVQATVIEAKADLTHVRGEIAQVGRESSRGLHAVELRLAEIAGLLERSRSLATPANEDPVPRG